MDTFTKKVIGQTLKEIRESNGFTTDTVYKVVNVSYDTYSRWEAGKNYPSIGSLMEFCELMGITVAEFFKKAGY